MRIWIDDTFATTVFTAPLTSGWVSVPSDFAVEIVAGLDATSIGPEDAAVAPLPAVLPRHDSHAVLTDVAVVADALGAVAMRTPVRPDEVEPTPIRLPHPNGVAELLARATVTPFYGIEATAWVRDDAAPEANTAQVVIVEGAEALREPEAGFQEDLVRAWFILTAKPVVTHLTLVPRNYSPEQRRELAALLAMARDAGLGQRGEWIPALADREGIARDRSSAFWAAQRLSLTESDVQAVRDLLRDGRPGTTGPIPAGVEFISDITQE